MFPQPNQPNPRCCSGPLHQTIHGQSFHPIPPPSIHSIHIHISRALGGVSAAESTVLLRATAKASTPFHPHPSIHPSIHLSLNLAGSKVLKRPLVRTLGLNPAGVLLFRNRGVEVFLRPHPRCCQGHGQSFHPIPPPSIHPSIHLSLLLAGSKVLKRPLVRKPIGHPLGVNPAGVLLFRNRALGDVSAAESTVLLRAVTSNDPRPKLPPHSTPIRPFHPSTSTPIHPSIHPSLCF